MINKEFKEKFNSFPFIDYEDFNAITFNVHQMEDGALNLLLDFICIDTDVEDFPYEYGYTLRTTIFEDNLVDMSKHVQAFLDLGMFNHLTYLSESLCLTYDGEVDFAFNFDDYFDSETTMLN